MIIITYKLSFYIYDFNMIIIITYKLSFNIYDFNMIIITYKLSFHLASYVNHSFYIQY